MQREQPDDQDAAWRAIVENYGESVLEPDPSLDALPESTPVVKQVRPEPRDEVPDELLPDPDDAFVPPTPPPLPRPPIDRLLAWLGVFGAPAVLLFFVITGLGMPQLVGWALVGWFLVGFGYLVMQMPSEPRDPWDNGAQL
ncbi:hypothetical protein [Nocardioides sp. Root190]|uniref:hypothetical protein n=1 Tax=Nocardioides sp. Root190 TaxID=1736488 RepID=UPI000AA8EA65|nr:hypothetical protein [Nocardioides sp. Root190]